MSMLKLPPEQAELLGRIRTLPAAQPLLAHLRDGTAPVHLVGGAVRDLLLGGAPFDLDLVVEGDAAAFAASLGGTLKLHDRFGTSTVVFDGFAYDIARARRETYARPGALPDVVPATLAEDLSRRDFTVNAIAVALTGRLPGRAERGARRARGSRGVPAARAARPQLRRRPHPAAAAGPLRRPAALRGRAAHRALVDDAIERRGPRHGQRLAARRRAEAARARGRPGDGARSLCASWGSIARCTGISGCTTRRSHGVRSRCCRRTGGRDRLALALGGARRPGVRPARRCSTGWRSRPTTAR